MAKQKRPLWFKVFLSQKALIDYVPEDQLGRAVKAVFAYFESQEDPQGLDALENAVFASFRPFVDEAFSDYVEAVENGKRGGRPKNPPLVGVREGKGLLGCPTEVEEEIEGKEEVEGSMADKPPRTRFYHPSVEEVRAYCYERKNNVDAQRFVDFYQANGWAQGRGKPIKDWKAAVRTWESSGTNKGQEVENDEFKDVH